MADTTLNAAISEVQATDTGMSWLRLAIAIPVGAAITFSLFILMTILIATGEKAFDEKDKGPSIDFVRVKRDERSDTLDRRLPQKLPPPVAHRHHPCSRPPACGQPVQASPCLYRKLALARFSVA